MSADLHLHIFEGIVEDDLKVFFSNSLGSKYCNVPSRGAGNDDWNKSFTKLADTPNIWIGSVSWLKAGLSGDSDTFVPSTIGKVQELIGEDLPTLDDDLIQRILDAFKLENKTSYSLQQVQCVKKFLDEHKGKKVFTVSW